MENGDWNYRTASRVFVIGAIDILSITAPLFPRVRQWLREKTEAEGASGDGTHFDKSLFCGRYDRIPEYAGVPNSHCCWGHIADSIRQIIGNPDYLSHTYKSLRQATLKIASAA